MLIRHPDGFLYQAGVMDFAGGNVVHITSGVAGAIATVLVCSPHSSPPNAEPSNFLLTFLGQSLIWVGWFAFNAAAHFKANGRSSMALINTQITAGAGAISWVVLDWVLSRKPKVSSVINGAIAGLVAATPSCGWIDQVAFAIVLHWRPELIVDGCLFHRSLGGSLVLPVGKTQAPFRIRRLTRCLRRAWYWRNPRRCTDWLLREPKCLRSDWLLPFR